MTKSENNWQDKSVLITGVCGTVGGELLRQVVEKGPGEVIGIDNNESELFFIQEEYQKQSKVKLFLGDLRDPDKSIRMMKGVDIVVHAAALKHVMLCEQAPRDAVQTNINGVQNIIDAALANQVDRVLFTSSDKAVNPSNVMGTSKLMGERLMTAANSMRRGDRPIFASTRFGNVLGSRGSVIPLFKRQIARGGPITLTNKDMTRFIMSLEDAVKLVMESVFMAKGGEVIVTKMPVVRIEDLAYVMRDQIAPKFGHDPQDIKIDVVGQWAGEKLYEELLNEEETRRTLELDKYFVVLPAFKSIYEKINYCYEGSGGVGIEKPYNSAVEKPLSYEELTTYLKNHGLLEIGE